MPAITSIQPTEAGSPFFSTIPLDGADRVPHGDLSSKPVLTISEAVALIR